MYSPKIDPEIIPALYRLARARGVPMTRLVNDTLAGVLTEPASQQAIAALSIPPKYDQTWRRAKAG